MSAIAVNEIVGIPVPPFIQQGKVLAILPDNKVSVEYQLPRQPKEDGLCDHCSSISLSMNGATGEIVCMSTGCGHEHGFDEKVETFLVNKIVRRN